MTKIITTVLLITTIFISGCAYKSNKISVDDYNKTRELNRERCTAFDVKKINDNDFHITQTCDIEYEGHRHQVLKECQFSTGKYLGNSLAGMIQGPIMIGLSPLHLLMGDVGGMFKWIGDGSLKLRIEHFFSLAEVQEAHRALEGRETTGKVILTP